MECQCIRRICRVCLESCQPKAPQLQSPYYWHSYLSLFVIAWVYFEKESPSNRMHAKCPTWIEMHTCKFPTPSLQRKTTMDQGSPGSTKSSKHTWSFCHCCYWLVATASATGWYWLMLLLLAVKLDKVGYYSSQLLYSQLPYPQLLYVLGEQKFVYRMFSN